ncbi:hypothetical protein Pint_05628 [Pistacia integerrima]|uniref:Uncharacterized protein n=1 Tax=Pistacia integerrima TaxID=434235 RepID=A0ACC0Z315_9ROSI|nr:hypothetical protein Pint_05628 [Pistacia integerrima]
MIDPVPPHQDFSHGIATKDVTINDTTNLRVRIYQPEKQHDDQHKLPILLHFHGGGFCVSQPNCFMYYNIYSRLAKSVPAVIVSVYLRLAPEHRLPAACDDGFEALMWLRSLAQGGNVVHEVAARAGNVHDITPLKLVGAIPIHPGFMRAERSKSELEKPESPFLTLEMVDKLIKLALPEGCNKDHHLTCPMGAAAPPLNELKLPPFLVCVAENDLMYDTELEYYEAMKKAEKDVGLVMSNGMGHCFYLNKIAIDMDPKTGGETSNLIQSISEFIKKH